MLPCLRGCVTCKQRRSSVRSVSAPPKILDASEGRLLGVPRDRYSDAAGRVGVPVAAALARGAQQPGPPRLRGRQRRGLRQCGYRAMVHVDAQGGVHADELGATFTPRRIKRWALTAVVWYALVRAAYEVGGDFGLHLGVFMAIAAYLMLSNFDKREPGTLSAYVHLVSFSFPSCPLVVLPLPSPSFLAQTIKGTRSSTRDFRLFPARSRRNRSTHSSAGAGLAVAVAVALPAKPRPRPVESPQRSDAGGGWATPLRRRHKTPARRMKWSRPPSERRCKTRSAGKHSLQSGASTAACSSNSRERRSPCLQYVHIWYGWSRVW